MTGHPRAFTLVEVLVALAIFAMAAVVLGLGYVNVLNSYQLADQAVTRNDDVEFARLAVLTEADREVVERGGDFDAGGNRRLTWKAAVRPTETPDVYEVEFLCVINRPQQKKPEEVRQVFRLLRPTWSKPDERDKLRNETRDRIVKLTTQRKS